MWSRVCRTGLVVLVALTGCVADDGEEPTATIESGPTPTAMAAPTATSIPTATVEVDSPWGVVHRREVTHLLRIAGFADEMHGVTVAPQGRPAYYTDDGGETWVESEGIDRCNYGLDFVDDQVVWECNKTSSMVSEDGGRSWAAKGEAGHSCRISFADAETGWVLLTTRLELTVDGGESWEEVPLPVSRLDVNALSLRTAEAGYLMTKDGSMYATEDGGGSWSLVPLDLNISGPMALAYFNIPSRQPAAAIRFFDADNGLVVMNLTDGRDTMVVAMRTADGGQTWSDEVVAAGAGTPFLTRDGTLLTLHEFMSNTITVLAYTGE